MLRRRNQQRVQKTTGHKLAELEDHLVLLSQALDGLESGQIAHLRHLAAELRVLICESSGTKGLLWRLADELRVDDAVVLHQIGNVDPAHPLAQGLRFHFLPLCSPGRGDPRLPVEAYSLRDIIETHEAIFGSGQGITHQRLIKWLCEQVGSGHEDEGIAPPLAELNSVLVGNAQAFFAVLQADAVLTAEVAERVLLRAIADLHYRPRAESFVAARYRDIPRNTAIPRPLPGPVIEAAGTDEGTLFLLLNSREPTWLARGTQVRFSPLTAGPVRIDVEKTVEHDLVLTVTGLSETAITSRGPFPEDTGPNGVGVAVTWGPSEIIVYVNGNPRERLGRARVGRIRPHVR